MADSSLEAAARSLWEDQPVAQIWSWDSLMDGSRTEYRIRARAALLAAVQVLPETFLCRINLKTEEWAPILESDPTLEQEKAHRHNVRKSLLAQAMGLGDQPNG